MKTKIEIKLRSISVLKDAKAQLQLIVGTTNQFNFESMQYMESLLNNIRRIPGIE